MINEIPTTRKYNILRGEKSCNFEKTYDAYIITTDHDEFRKYDFSDLQGAIIDTRGMLRDQNLNARMA